MIARRLAPALAIVGVVALAAPAGAETLGADPGWGGGHSIVIDVDGGFDQLDAVAIQPDGKVVVAGQARIAGDTDAILLRFDADGTLDDGFGNGGTVLFDGGYTDVFHDLAVQPDGRIVAVGASVDGPNMDELVVRLLADGSPDPSFGSAGDGVTIGPVGALMDAEVLPDGSIVAAGNSGQSYERQEDVSLRRYTSDGTWDDAFGGLFDIGSTVAQQWSEETAALAHLDDGAWMVVGMHGTSSPDPRDVPTWPFAMRFAPDGTPDTAFGTGGARVLQDQGYGRATDVIPAPGGAAVMSIWNFNQQSTVTRLLASGVTDAGFGAGGTVRQSLVPGGLVRDTSGRIVTLERGRTITVLRYSADGAVDPSLTEGSVEGASDNDFPTASAFLPDGRLVIAGSGVTGAANFDLVVARLAVGPDPAPSPTTTTSTTTPPTSSVGGSGSTTAGGGGGGSTSSPGPTTTTTAPPPATSSATGDRATAVRSGYWMLAANGTVHAFGDAADRGSAPTGAAIDLAATSTGGGYWVLDRSGRVQARGDAATLGSATGLPSSETAVSIAATPSGHGYWIVTTAGRVFPFGDAGRFGDLAATRLNAPVIDAAPTATGRGYYLVAADGGVFTFGDARFAGSTGNRRLNAPVRALVPDPDGRGYWLLARDGGVFAFDAGFRGSMGGHRLNAPITGMIAYGNGYLMTASDGGAFVFSDRPFRGSLGSTPSASPIVSIAALP